MLHAAFDKQCVMAAEDLLFAYLTRDNGQSKRTPPLNPLTTHGLELQAVISDDLELTIDDSIALSHITTTLSGNLSVM